MMRGKGKRYTIALILFFTITILSSCGDNSKTDAGSTDGGGTEAQHTDIITESQNTRKQLDANIQSAQAMLSSVSANGEPVDSTDIIRHTTGEAPAGYKPRGQMASSKYGRYNTEKIYNNIYLDKYYII